MARRIALFAVALEVIPGGFQPRGSKYTNANAWHIYPAHARYKSAPSGALAQLFVTSKVNINGTGLVLSVGSMLPGLGALDAPTCQRYCHSTSGCNAYVFCSKPSGCGEYCPDYLATQAPGTRFDLATGRCGGAY